MLSMKLIGGCLLIITGYGVGFRRVRLQEMRLETLNQLERMLARIRDEIQYRGIPLEEIRQLLLTLGGFEALHLDEYPALKDLKLPLVLAKNQRDVLEQVFQTLGQRTSQESTVQLDYYRQLCLEFAEEERKQLVSAKHLYRQIGVCAGLAVALLLL